MNFFESSGTHLKEEDHGRMFPVSNRSKTIVETLFDKLMKLGVTIYTEAKAEKILSQDNQVIGIELAGEKIYAPCIIVSTGGLTYPSTGSTGDGYKLAKKLGHSITPLYATESPIICNDHFILTKVLQGLSLQNVSLSVLTSKGKILVSHQMDVLFTHFGLSGPAALRCSSFVNQELAKTKEKSITLSLDVFPETSQTDLMHLLQHKIKEQPGKSLKNALKNILPERLLNYYLTKLDLAETTAKIIDENQLVTLVSLLKTFNLHATKTFPLEKSFVTGGGVCLKEVNPKTMESKRVNGLFFTGELLDINGYTGGYNVTAAFVTGYVAGHHAAEIAKYTYLPEEM